MRQPFCGRIAALTAAPARKCKRTAFTLIELLVVVSIIALLVAMLVPALEDARKTARMAVCQTTLKSQGLALNLYAGDNNELFPYGRNLAGANPQGVPQATWNVYMLSRAGMPDAMDGRIGLAMLYPTYIGDAHLFYCPEISVQLYQSPSTTEPWSYNHSVYGWGTNWSPGNPSTDILAGYLYGACNRSLTYAAGGDVYRREVFYNRAIVTDVYTIGYNPSAHGLGYANYVNGLNVLKGDGSVFYYENQDLTDFYDISSGTWPEAFWWDEFTNSDS